MYAARSRCLAGMLVIPIACSPCGSADVLEANSVLDLTIGSDRGMGEMVVMTAESMCIIAKPVCVVK